MEIHLWRIFRSVESIGVPRLGVRAILVRELVKHDWALTDKVTLAGFPIHKWTDIPRSLDKNGQQRFDLFAFVLKEYSSAANFSIGR